MFDGAAQDDCPGKSTDPFSSGYAGQQFYGSVVKERNTGLQADRHTGAICPQQQIVDQRRVRLQQRDQVDAILGSVGSLAAQPFQYILMSILSQPFAAKVSSYRGWFDRTATVPTGKPT